MKNMTSVKWGFFGAKGMTDFDIGIGWQTRGNYDDFKQWVFSVIRLRRAGEISGRYFSLAMITILGFYARIHLLGPLMETNIQGQENNE